MSNCIIISIFEKLISQKQREIQDLKDLGESKSKITSLTFKIISFRKALKILRSYPLEINSTENLSHIKGMGKGIIKRIDEILATGDLKSELKSDEQFISAGNNIANLQRITGIGPAKAKKLHQQGIHLSLLLDEVKRGRVPDLESVVIHELNKGNKPKISELLSHLTHHQYIGLKHFEDTEKRIPRQEIQTIETMLSEFITSPMSYIICGSYRRGCPDSGDIDMLITHKKIITNEQLQKDKNNFLLQLVARLTDTGFLIDHLTTKGKTKYMGYCRLGPQYPARRIDIRFVSYDCFYPAILYFTGSGNFNQNMRGNALRQDYTLNEYGLFKIAGYDGRKIIKGNKVIVNSEREIFDVLGMSYIEPRDRNI